jgi:maltose alpha-D-glucosyltransferase/alpha-amylase
MPFYPTPDLDDGYDVTDLYGVDPRYGSLGDVVDFLRAAREHGLRVIADLVVNHTSDRHPWFREARASRDSPYREFYVWSDDPPKEKPGDVIFPGVEDSIWDYDEEAGQWFLHRFYGHQPDLNVADPRVREEIFKALGFWLELGLSGFRVDAVPYFIEHLGMEGEAGGDPHELLRDLRAFLSRRRGDAVLLGEVNLPPKELGSYFGDEGGDELHMLFDFIANQALYLALVRQEAEPLARALEARPATPDANGWATFVRNHDELTLDKLTDAEREEVFSALAPEEEMRIFGRGIRRRVPPMLGSDRSRIELVYSLLFSLPGTPVLLYGEEIGMGENLAAEGRMSVRTPMQWTAAADGGFSDAEPADFCVPLAEGDYGPARVNVESQQHDPESLLNWTSRVVALRRQCPEISWGEVDVVDVGERAVLAHRCTWRDRTLVAAHNFAAEARTVRLDGVNMFTGEREGPELALEPYGYRWLRPAN